MNERNDGDEFRALFMALLHDVRGPLTSILGFAEMIEDGSLDKESVADAARTIRSSAQRLAQMVEDASEKFTGLD